MIKRILTLSLFTLSLFCLSSWTNYDDSINTDSIAVEYKFEEKYNVKDFYKDAYKYCLKNGYKIPDYYYEYMEIPNPYKPISNPVVVKPISTHDLRNNNVPEWVICGILKTETKSYYNEDGYIVYVNRKRGTSGERGPFQVTPDAFKQVAKRGEKFYKIEKDMVLAQAIAERYLLYLYNNFANNKWEVAIKMYNTGPHNYYHLFSARERYFNLVKENSK